MTQRSAWWLLGAVLSCGLHGDDHPEVSGETLEFVNRYCMECHDADTEKGDRNFEALWSDPGSESAHMALEEIIEQLNLGEMPPKKSEQPSDAERRELISVVSAHLTEIEQAGRPADTPLRRLTRYEYNHTIRDLLGVDPVASDATALFLDEPHLHGFRTAGEPQVLSDAQLARYLEAARTYVGEATVFGEDRPEPESWSWKGSEFDGQPYAWGGVGWKVLRPKLGAIEIAHGQRVARRPLAPPGAFQKSGVPVSGRYRVTFKATALGRLDHPYEPELIPLDPAVPYLMTLSHAPDQDLLGKSASQGRVQIETFTLLDNKAETFEATFFMPRGSIPFVHWSNGPGAPKRMMREITEKHHPEARHWGQTELDELREKGLPLPDLPENPEDQKWLSDFYVGPRIHLHEMTIEGPLVEHWPPEGHTALFGPTTDATEVDIPEVLVRFANRAFRRPVAEQEIAHYIAYAFERLVDGASRAEAIEAALAAILVSPRFLYLDEGEAEKRPKVDAYALACRLSYGIWGTMPDTELRALADSGDLMQATELVAQFDRLLADPRSAVFVEQFARAWLRLDKLGSMPPSEKQFPLWARDNLEQSMRFETRHLFDHVLRNNLPVREFFEAEYSFLNNGLARHYGIEANLGNEFEKVVIPAAARRRGLLGHGSVLTATANGVDTSPVVRGVWVLENLLGTPPAPPPADVPPIEPDTRGATTIREQLAKHREVAACADCHAKIDPWGFALEFYDPVGALRTHYGRRHDIDGSGTLPDGVQILDENGLRDALVARERLVARNLVAKFLLHATGREPTAADTAEVNAIVEANAESGYRLRSLIRRTVNSPLFRKP